MELRHLRYLVMVAEESHFTRAAHRLGIAQPALSQQIRRLEVEVGLPLVERTTRRVRLTEAGRLLVEQARRVLVEADHAVTVLDDLRGLRAGRVAIGASQTMASVDLSRLLATFHRSFPAVEMVVQEDFSLELASALRGDELDLAFITVSEPGDGLEARAVATEPLVCIVPSDHVLAQRGHIDLRDVKEESFIAFRRGATIRQTIEEATGERGFVPRVMFETNNVSRMRGLVATGLGIAVLPQTDAVRMGDSVATVPFSGASLTHTVYLGWRENRRHSPAAQAFVDLVLAA
jgi:DNA-binding transcriptional LysR family regulator